MLLLLQGLALMMAIAADGNREFTLTVPANFTAVHGRCDYAMANTSIEVRDANVGECAALCGRDRLCGSFHYIPRDLGERGRCIFSNSICNYWMTAKGPGFITRATNSSGQISSIYLMKTKETWTSSQGFEHFQMRKGSAFVEGCCKLENNSCGYAFPNDGEELKGRRVGNVRQCHAQCLKQRDCLSFRVRWTDPSALESDENDCFISSVFCNSVSPGRQTKAKGYGSHYWIDEAQTFFMLERIGEQRTGAKFAGEKISIMRAGNVDDDNGLWVFYFLAATLMILPSCMFVAWVTSVRYESYNKFDNEV